MLYNSSRKHKNQKLIIRIIGKLTILFSFLWLLGLLLFHHLAGLVPLGGGVDLVQAQPLPVALVSLPTFSVY